MGKYSGRTVLLAGVPLALATSGLAAGCGVSGGNHVSADRPHVAARSAAPAQAPADPSVPALTAVPRQGAIKQSVAQGQQRSLMQDAAYTEVSEAALSAYQRAAQVIDAADPTCRLSWTLLAALGQVEGRYGAYGPVLNGRHGKATVPDTDAGKIDGDARWDRAVGPMQLLPTTWSQVAVDADGDGRRDPQDVDDAALGAAVYLCGADDDLGTRLGKRSAVFRYNHSRPYVLFVLALSHKYALSEQALSPMMAARTVSATAVDVTGTTDPSAPADEPTVAVAVPKKPKKPAVAAAAPTASATSAASAGTPTGGPTGGATGSPTGSASPTPSGSATPTCPTGTPTGTPSPSPTTTPDPTCPTPSPTASGGPSSSTSPTTGASRTESPSATPSTTAEASPSATETP